MYMLLVVKYQAPGMSEPTSVGVLLLRMLLSFLLHNIAVAERFERDNTRLTAVTPETAWSSCRERGGAQFAYIILLPMLHGVVCLTGNKLLPLSFEESLF